VSACVAPTAIDAAAGASVTVVTTGAGAVTVIVAVPVLPEDVAVIVAVPAETPLTTPLEFTVALFEALVDHVTICPAIVFPF
jgi:hypothetical protein